MLDTDWMNLRLHPLLSLSCVVMESFMAVLGRRGPAGGGASAATACVLILILFVVRRRSRTFGSFLHHCC